MSAGYRGVRVSRGRIPTRFSLPMRQRTCYLVVQDRPGSHIEYTIQLFCTLWYLYRSSLLLMITLRQSIKLLGVTFRVRKQYVF
jgi:hypothetical protein